MAEKLLRYLASFYSMLNCYVSLLKQYLSELVTFAISIWRNVSCNINQLKMINVNQSFSKVLFVPLTWRKLWVFFNIKCTNWYFTMLCATSNAFPCCRLPSIKLQYLTFTWLEKYMYHYILSNLGFTIREGRLGWVCFFWRGHYFWDILALCLGGRYYWRLLLFRSLQ